MTKIPLFIHINSSGGRYMRSKFCEKYNDNFIVHHINPRLYRDIVPRNKVVRCWKYRDPYLKYSTMLMKFNNVSIFDIKDTIPFIVLRDPIQRYKTENRNISEPWEDARSYNIICKSLYVAFTGDYNDFFLEFTEDKYNSIINFMKTIKVITLNQIDELTNLFEFNSPPVYKSSSRENEHDKKKIEDINYFDCKLYNLYTEGFSLPKSHGL